ncbi:copper resistance protein NlpE [Shewanella psychrotolerans]|uniref:copper resistance protein NlpE n=1 Tax=Shewanella psychrotolerans TaxID=2864206 RepID=UPI001C65A54B|nr:copper resistance protein NlpE [Shewanella psychrotolerans]QYK00760.1 copper resistance protein NlpE [Shewanella psychrotolerans]
MKTTARIFPLIFIALSACSIQSTTVNSTNVEPTPMPIGDNSRTSLDWPGVYEGLLPCSNCKGIKLRLQLNSDNSYQLTQNHLGQTDTPEVQIGHFNWNARGSYITLDTNESPMLFQVGENQLFMLNSDATRISGELANRYRLLKVQ